jgi:hypothetical protein
MAFVSEFQYTPLYKIDILSGSKTLLSLSGIGEKNFFSNFEHYDLGNDKEYEPQISWRCKHTS